MTKDQWLDIDAARESAWKLRDMDIYYQLNAILEGLECE